MALESGSRLGPYEIVGLLGSGAMGKVYRARDPRLEREVAIKVLLEEVADRKQLGRFEQEARAAGALNHPNVLAVHDVGTHDGAPYVVSELLEGQTLRARLEGGPPPVRKALDYALEIARGLAAAHDKGIVHRDLKPDNVFVTNDDRIKILDFGLAKLTRPTPLVREGDQGTGPRATESGMVLGTVGFMSPEQVRGEAVDHRSDIFSFGALLYEMLTGVRAFRRDSAVETMNAILKEDPPEVSRTGRGISPGVARLVSRCLEKRAGDRFHSAHDLALALEAVSSGVSAPSDEEGRRSGVARAVSVTKRYKKALLATATMLLVAVGLYRGLVRSPAPAVVGAIDSVAVLPFENVGGDPDREYLSDGIAESLINELSRLPDLKVIARSTSFRFRGKEVDPRQVGRDLKVGAVLTGRVSQRGDTVAIGAELVDVAQGTQLWGERYNTRMADISTLQQDIARDISRRLRRKVAPRDETSPTTRHTENSEAYRLDLLSRYHYSTSTPEGLKRAVEYAQQSIEKDPTYAPAYTALANSYIQLGLLMQLSNRDALSRARTAAMTALEIDESLPEAHFDLAQVQSRLDWDWAGAERGYKRALELDPNSAAAHDKYMFHLTIMGRFEEGIAHAKRAVELDPLTPRHRLGIGRAYYFARQFDQALRAAREALEFGSNPGIHYLFGWVYREKGMYEEAIAEFRELLKQDPRAAAALAHLGNTYARAGRVREARECIRQLKQRSGVETVETYGVAMIHAGLGEKDQAFEWLEKAYEMRDQGLSFLKVGPELDPLRLDARFQDLLRRMNFPS
jgi:eukaryotic-like serine/threonine-protein kinase